MIAIYDTRLSKDFCERWKYLLRELYGYKFEGELASVKSILRIKTLSYLPLTNYTDLTTVQAKELMSNIGSGRNYQIRILNSSYKDFRYLDTVTMRLSLNNKHIDNIWKDVLDQKCRNKIRQAEKNSLVIQRGCSEKLIDDFYTLYINTMHYHGTPALKREFFYLLGNLFDARFYVVYKNSRAISAIVLINDNDLAIIGWGASDRDYLGFRPNNYVYWESIKDSVEADKKIFDFGRSGFKANTYSFKRHFGAVPVKIDILKRNPENIYKKYQTASIIWKKLPRKVSYYMGPRLCKYLIDL